ncbi:PRC-barrel domain-containing protein [Fodinicurvata fenggangensis]|uniref:PRC-barrel domain-containing protein n=1 Tax=Fodinicurvata fenggangensis TaxID=1121830 RepID=UPI0004798AA3|nr:PRC-barrel domain-containing protein [Fodinicurvata fenggangensis]
MKPRITTLIPAAALLLASTSLAVAQSSITSEQDSGQPAETTQSSPESGSDVNAESGEGESEKEDYAGDEEGAELGEAFDDDAAHSAEEGAKVEEEDDIGAAEETEEAAEDTAESVEDTAEDAAESVEETAEEAAEETEDAVEGADEAMDEALDEDEAESTSVETSEDDSVDISQLRPLEGEYEGVTLSNGMNAEDVAGAAIVNQEGDEVARVDDLLANEAGEVQAVLAKSGGILGIGAKELAIELSELSPGEEGELVTSLTEEDIEDMPEYEAPEDME